MSKPVFTTGVYTKDAIEVFNRTLLWVSTQTTSSNRSSPNRCIYSEADIYQRPNGEVVITSKQFEYNSRICKFKNNGDFRRWLAYKIKSMCYSLYGKEFWDRANDNEVDFMGDPNSRYNPMPAFYVPYSVFYFLYETLLQRKGSRKKYSSTVVDRFGGVENDPILTQAEQQRRDDIAQLKADYSSKQIKIEHQRYVELTDVKNAIMSKYQVVLDELTAKYKADLKALEELKFIA